MKNMYENIQHCRISDSKELITILELGEQPLANACTNSPDAQEHKFPLTLVYSPESSLVQLRETVNKEELFSNYTWVTGTSLSTRDYAKLFFQRIVETVKPDWIRVRK